MPLNPMLSSSLCLQLNGKMIEVGSCGHDILSISRESGIMICSACYGHALCGSCKIRILQGAENISPIEEEEIEALVSHGYYDHIKHKTNPSIRLACQSILLGPVTAETIIKTQ